MTKINSLMHSFTYIYSIYFASRKHLSTLKTFQTLRVLFKRDCGELRVDTSENVCAYLLAVEIIYITLNNYIF